MNRVRFSSPSDRYSAHVQRGSALLEVALAVAITGALVVGGMQYWSQQLRSDTARALAGQYKLVGAAVDRYMIANSNLLTSDILPADCDKGSVFTQGLAVATQTVTCSADVRGNDQTTYRISHALQPTIADLQRLNFLPRTVNGQPVLPHDPGVPTVSIYSGTTHILSIHIQRVCINQENPAPMSCTQANRDLRSLVFNQRPYRTGVNGDWSMLNEAMLAMENDGLVSMPGIGGASRDIVGLRGDTTLPNPISGDASAPPPFGVLAMRGGIGSSAWGQFTLRDGSALPTADWTFDKKSLTEVNRLEGSAVVAKDAFLLPKKIPGSTCDSGIESVSLSTSNQALQVCENGKWAAQNQWMKEWSNVWPTCYYRDWLDQRERWRFNNERKDNRHYFCNKTANSHQHLCCQATPW
jgi:hypothetical protein